MGHPRHFRARSDRVQTGDVGDLDEFVNEVTSRARKITDGSGSPSELGIEIWAMTLTDSDELQAVARPLSLIFGNLTDPVDWPGREDEMEAAEARIKRAAREWLVVAEDHEARDQYFDRWLYGELGYQRPFIWKGK